MKKENNNAQMIMIMGILLAVSVYTISTLAAEIANIGFTQTNKEYISLSDEYASLKETFGLSLNYNLTNIIIGNSSNGYNIDESYIYGDIDEIEKAFEVTKNDYFNIYLKHGTIFDASLNECWFSHREAILGNSTIFYNVAVTLSLDNGNTYVDGDVTYKIGCISED